MQANLSTVLATAAEIAAGMVRTIRHDAPYACAKRIEQSCSLQCFLHNAIMHRRKDAQTSCCCDK